MGLEGIVSKHKLSRYTSGPLTGLAQEQESGERGGAAGGGGRLGQAAMAIATEGTNRIMIYGPKEHGTYVVEFMTAAGHVLAERT